MFGYVTIRKDDLKVKDYNKYQAYYCGLCQDIKEAYGKKGQAMLPSSCRGSVRDEWSYRSHLSYRTDFPRDKHRHCAAHFQ